MLKFNEKVEELFKKNFSEKTLVQKILWESYAEENNYIISAPTGSGKTEAVLFPIFSRILDEKLKKISCLYITPLKSLNRDLLRRIREYCNFLGLEVEVRHGDTTQLERKYQREYPPDLLIITLETLQPLLVAKTIREYLKNVKFVIIDEIHEVIDSKRGTQLVFALDRLKILSRNFQIFLISATIGNIIKIQEYFNANFIPITSEEVKNYQFKIVFKENSEERLNEIYNLVKNSDSCIIFTNTREFCEALGNNLKKFEDLKIEVHHSSLEKEVREKVEKMLKNKELNAVVATSSLQLGIDIGSVDLVIQYQSPRQVSQLLQRVGRASHFITKVSNGIIICRDFDDILESYAIVKSSLQKKIEDFHTFKNCLDVLLHQICGMLLEYKRLGIKNLFSFVKRIYAYKTLSYEKFLEVLNFGVNLGYFLIEGETLIPRRKIHRYFFKNISTIPSKKEFKVINVSSKKVIGKLDEDFVKLDLEEDKNFLLKGESWRVISIDEENYIVNVEPSNEIETSIPSWKGELMEVPFEIAQEVGKLRKSLGLDENILNEEAIKYVKEIISKQNIIPDDKTILIDFDEEKAIFNCCFGNRVNETLAILISSLVSSKFNVDVDYECSAYRITINFPFSSEEQISEVIEEIKKIQDLEIFLKMVLKNLKIFKVKFLDVAKRFGLIEDESKLSKIILEKLAIVYSNSIVGEEVANEIVTSKLDLEKTNYVIDLIRNNEIKIFIQNKLSPISLIGFEEKLGYVEAFEPKEIFENVRERILNTELYLICSSCFKFKDKIKVKHYIKRNCPYCQSAFIAATKHLKTKKFDEKFKEELKVNSNFLLDYGKYFLMALGGRGIGTETAIRILKSMKQLNENELVKRIYEEEKRFLQTRKFWKI